MTPPTIDEMLDDLSPAQRQRLEAVKRAKEARDIAIDVYGRTIMEAHDAGITYGSLARELGIPRQSVWRSEQRYKRRAVGEAFGHGYDRDLTKGGE